MSRCLKGVEQRFVFSHQDTRNLLRGIFSLGLVVVKGYVDRPEERLPTREIIEFENLRSPTGSGSQTPQRQFFIVSSRQLVVWSEIQLLTGKTRFSVDPTGSHAVQLLLSPQNNERIGVGRISVCKQWLNEDGSTGAGSVELEIYRETKRLIRITSAGSVWTASVGKHAYELWRQGKIMLAPDLNNPEVFVANDYEAY